MTRIDTNYSNKRIDRMDHQRISLTPSILSEIAEDVLFCEKLRESSFTITELISSSVDMISETLEDGSLNAVLLYRLRSEIRVLCLAQNRMVGRLVERLESQLKFFELYRAVQDSMSVRLLTILATIFIPMSLASGILSMQTHFAVLRYLLYDFCGVITIIGTLAVTIFVSIKAFMMFLDHLTEARARFVRLQRFGDMVFWPVMGGLFVMAISFWALVFTSFMVGMIKDVGLGLRILGYGCAAYVGLGLVVAIMTVRVVVT